MADLGDRSERVLVVALEVDGEADVKLRVGVFRSRVFDGERMTVRDWFGNRGRFDVDHRGVGNGELTGEPATRRRVIKYGGNARTL